MSAKFIPQALADETSRCILAVFRDEESFRPWVGKFKTIDAPGVEIHPRLIAVGDVIDWYPTGWTRVRVREVIFTPDENDIPEFHRSGAYRFATDEGFFNVRVDGRHVIGAPIHVFR